MRTVLPGLLSLALLPALAAAPARAEGGTIVGRVEATPARYRHETVVFLREVKGITPPRPRKVVLDERGLRFLPHVLAINAGDTVQFLNNDNVEHNVFTPDHEGYNLGLIKPQGMGTYTFDRPGVYTQLCSVHAEMLAYIFVGSHPFQAVVDATTGAFRLERVPPGTWTVAVWNSHLRAPDQQVTVAEGRSSELSFSLTR